MKKSLFILLAAATAACAPRHTITGHIDNLTNDTLFLFSQPLDSDAAERIDTLLAVNNEFRFDIPIGQPTSLVIIPSQLTDIEQGQRFTNFYGSKMRFFLDKGECVVLKGRIDSVILNCKLSGSRLNEDYSRHYQEVLPFWAEGNRLQDAIARCPRAEREALYEQFQQVMERRRVCEMDYIKANPNNPLSAYCLCQVRIDSVYSCYELLGDEARNSIFRPLIEPLLADAEKHHLIRQAKARIVPGAPAPDFTLERTDGTGFTLSSLRGKYVVLDFWGSWCGWCIKGFPEMKAAYKKYKGKLEIVGIDCRDTQEKWLAAIESHKLPWINVYNPEKAPAAESVSVRYAVEGYPTKVIIDPEGRIVSVFDGESPDFYKKLAETVK